MLTRADVARIAREEGLAQHADSLVESVRPGWRLEPSTGGEDPPPGAAKIGGHPDLAPGEAWPRNGRGVARPPGAPLLRVFADLLEDPFEPGPARVLATSAIHGLTRTSAPAIPKPWPTGGPQDGLAPGERVRALPETAVEPVGFLTAPESHPLLSPEALPSGPPAERYYAWINRLRIDGRAPEAHLAEPDAWQTVLGLHDDPRFGLHILDGGAYTVLVPSTDLRAGRYDRAMCSIDSN